MIENRNTASPGGSAALPPIAQPKSTLFTPGFAPVLTISYGFETKDFPLTTNRLSIGRHSENDIVVPVSTVSRLHAVLTRDNGGYTIRDQNSTNGLLFEGVKIKERQLLDGDVLRVGDDLGNVATLTYQDPANLAPDHLQLLQLSDDLQSVTIGRAVDNALWLDYPQVSLHHAVIERGDNGTQAVLHDLGSTNGTFVDGSRVRSGTSAPLKSGQIIQIAGYRLVYQGNAISRIASESVRLEVVELTQTTGGKKSVVLLDNISLSINPKEFVAIVGGSGAGKSTLMDALNGFRPARAGQVLLNGEDFYHNFNFYRANLGYVPQEDIIHRNLSVERALYYAARLRLPADTTEQEIEQRVTTVLEEVEMTERRKVVVSRLSGGQRKRVSIAVELLVKPGLFFLDEPTSGLDPGLDKRMMFLLRRLADQGRTIILVTHATSHIMTCDKVIFLAPGGRLAFFGSPQNALAFFEVKEFADIYSKLEQTPSSGTEWAARFRQSAYYGSNVATLPGRTPATDAGEDEGEGELTRSQPLEDYQGAADSGIGGMLPSAAAAANPMQSQAGTRSTNPSVTAPASAKRPKLPKVSGWRQFLLLTRRYTELLWRDRITLLVLVMQAPIIGLVLALVAGDNIFAEGKPPITTQRVLFILAIVSVWLGCSNAAREITKEHPIYLRERLVNLRVLPYVMSKVVVLATLCLVQSLTLIGIVMLRCGVPDSGAFLPAPLELIISTWLTTLGGLGMGLLISALVSNSDKAASIVPILLVPQIILAGLIFPLEGAGKGLSYGIVSKWSIESLGTSANLNRLYYPAIATLTAGDGKEAQPSSLVVIPFDPANYDDDPSVQKDYYTGAFLESRRNHLLKGWGALAGLTLVLLSLTCYFQKRKDKAWKRS